MRNFEAGDCDMKEKISSVCAAILTIAATISLFMALIAAVIWWIPWSFELVGGILMVLGTILGVMGWSDWRDYRKKTETELRRDYGEEAWFYCKTLEGRSESLRTAMGFAHKSDANRKNGQ